MDNLSITGNNCIVKNNFIGYIGVNNASNVIISNNVISAISGSNQPSVVITNNIFIGGYFSSLEYANITNNFFIERRDNSYSTNMCTYHKNISLYYDQVNFVNLPKTGNTGVGNKNTVENQFVSDIIGKTINESRDYDWHLLPTSLGYKYGTDGTDCGIYGGSYPMPNMSGVTQLPQVISMDIQNSVIPVGGTLNVELKAKSIK
jgi:hypothetical protein